MLKAFLYFFAAVALFAAGYEARYYLEQGSTSSGTAASLEASGDLRRAAKLVRVTEWHWELGGLLLVATVENGSNRACNVALTFNLYDKSGAQVESTLGSIYDLQAGSKDRVTTGALHANTTARLVKINVF